MMAILRLKSWWMKMAMFLCLVYSSFLFESISTTQVLIAFIGLLLGAVWASIINNFCDVREDLISNKPNKFIGLSKLKAYFIITAVIVLGLSYMLFLIADLQTKVFYVLSWLCIFLYSYQGIRFKEIPYFDLLFDGLGTQLFPALFILSFCGKITLTTFSACLWLFFSMGVRSLIVHQNRDYKVDKLAGLKNFSNSVAPVKKSRFLSMLIVLEIFTFLGYLFGLSKSVFISMILILVVYLIWILIFRDKWSFFNSGKRLFLFDIYYLLPIVILVNLAIIDIKYMYILGVHIAIFHLFPRFFLR